MIKPKIKIIKKYPIIELLPISDKNNRDKLNLKLTKKGINISAVIDDAGNDFFIEWDKIKEYLE